MTDNAQPTVKKKSLFRRPLFWVAVVVVLIIIIVASSKGGSGGGTNNAAPSTGGSTTTGTAAPTAQAAQKDPLTDNNWTASDIRVTTNQFGSTANARIVNHENGTRSGAFTLTVFKDGKSVATFNGFANDVEGGSTATVQFVTTDDLGNTPEPYTYELQSDF